MHTVHRQVLEYILYLYSSKNDKQCLLNTAVQYDTIV